MLKVYDKDLASTSFTVVQLTLLRNSCGENTHANLNKVANDLTHARHYSSLRGGVAGNRHQIPEANAF